MAPKTKEQTIGFYHGMVEGMVMGMKGYGMSREEIEQTFNSWIAEAFASQEE